LTKQAKTKNRSNKFGRKNIQSFYAKVFFIDSVEVLNSLIKYRFF